VIGKWQLIVVYSLLPLGFSKLQKYI